MSDEALSFGPRTKVVLAQSHPRNIRKRLRAPSQLRTVRQQNIHLQCHTVIAVICDNQAQVRQLFQVVGLAHLQVLNDDFPQLGAQSPGPRPL